MVNDLLFELGCEELPSGSVWPLANELKTLLLTALDKACLQYKKVDCFATPRRLAIRINDLQTEQPSQAILRKGPAASSAFDTKGKPTPALLGFAKSCGVTIDKLSKVQTDKGEWMVYEAQSEAIKTHNLLPTLINQALLALAIAKPMRWGNSDIHFARPIHWAVLLFGDEVVEAEILGVKTGRTSVGHRFHSPKPIVIDAPASYEKQLEAAYVIVDFAQRRKIIQQQVQLLAGSYNANALMPDELVDEVNSIVEWPQALVANFEKEFLDVPAQALIASMQSHQKCFALVDKEGKLLPHFITVANIESSKPQQLVLGNEKVMRARLSDADFFFKQDKKQALSHHILATQKVVFQEKLGSLYDKAQRITTLMPYLCQSLIVPLELAERAAQLSKCDLLTGMVGEFPELQGLMGYYYALNDGEDPTVASALDEQYMPRFAADNIPKTDLGKALSLADRIDTLMGIFAIGQKPSGVKDPFKLRRHALAIVRMLIAIPSALSLSTLIHAALANYDFLSKNDKEIALELKSFILERLYSFYQSQEIGVELVQAVRARQEDWLYDLDKRVKALTFFVTLPEASSLCAACKRVTNILQQAGKLGLVARNIDEKLLEEGVEHELYNHIQAMEETVAPFYRSMDYIALLKELASLKQPIDAFFDKVMVMVEDEGVKTNRVALLQRLQGILQGVADISLIPVQMK